MKIEEKYRLHSIALLYSSMFLISGLYITIMMYLVFMEKASLLQLHSVILSITVFTILYFTYCFIRFRRTCKELNGIVAKYVRKIK